MKSHRGLAPTLARGFSFRFHSPGRAFPDNVGTGSIWPRWQEPSSMSRPLVRARGLCILLMLVHGATMFAAAAILAALFGPNAASRLDPNSMLVMIVVIMILVRAFVLAQMPAIVRNAHWQVLRPLT